MKRNLKDIFDIVDLANDIAHAKIGKEREVWEFLGLINCETLAENLFESGYRRAYAVRKEAARDIVKKYKEAFEVIREEREINKTAFDYLCDDVSDEILNDYGVEVDIE